jgi:hypothetical protein
LQDLLDFGFRRGSGERPIHRFIIFSGVYTRVLAALQKNTIHGVVDTYPKLLQNLPGRCAPLRRAGDNVICGRSRWAGKAGRCKRTSQCSRGRCERPSSDTEARWPMRSPENDT